MTERITIMHIAKAAGVGRSTVSRALTGDPRCAEKTREKVQKVAEELGYVPDPALSALVGHRERRRAPRTDYNLAVLFTNRDGGYISAIREGIRVAAEGFGYGVEYVENQDPLCADPRRLARTLRNRGVRGVIWGWLLDPAYLEEFPWHEFAHVGFLLPVVRPNIHRVRDDSFRTVMDAMEQVFATGSRRPGLALATSEGSFNDKLQYAAYLLACAEMNIPPAPLWKVYEDQKIEEWISEHQLDSVIGNVDGVYWKMQEAKVSGSISYTNLLHPSQHPEHSFHGFDCREQDIGSALVEILHRELRHNELGLTDSPMTHLIRRHFSPMRDG